MTRCNMGEYHRLNVKKDVKVRGAAGFAVKQSTAGGNPLPVREGGNKIPPRKNRGKKKWARGG